MDWHRWAGFAVLGLLVFRLSWGVLGGSTARFSHFVKGPGAAFAYLKGLFGRKAGPAAGHNPLGGWSVVALILTLIAVVVFGLFAEDVDGIESGPLARFVDFDTGRMASKLHHLSFDVLLVADRPAPRGDRLLRRVQAREPGRADGHGPAEAARGRRAAEAGQGLAAAA